jgi:hypothetical protein
LASLSTSRLAIHISHVDLSSLKQLGKLELIFTGIMFLKSYATIVNFYFPFRNLQSQGRTHSVLLIGLYELLGKPTTLLIEPSVPPMTLWVRWTENHTDEVLIVFSTFYYVLITTKTGRHDIAEILLKVTLSTTNQII